MKTIIKVLFLQLLYDAGIAIALSGFITLIRRLFTNVTKEQFLWLALIIFSIFVLDGIYNWIRTLALMKKDPDFKKKTMETGISWRDYKRMRK